MPRKKRQTIEPAFVSPQYAVPDAVRIQAPEVAAIILRHCTDDLSQGALLAAVIDARAELADRKLCLIYAALGDIERERERMHGALRK